MGVAGFSKGTISIPAILRKFFNRRSRQFATTTMAPSFSKLSQPQITGSRKRTASSRITDENFIGAESNAVTKRLKLSATGKGDTSRAAAVKP